MKVCLAGMHRSGTSLMSSYLECCGVSMGDSKLSGRIGNKYGLFEDREFLEFHKAIIRRNYSFLYMPKKHFKIIDKDYSDAKEMCDRNSGKYENWGWKDPRSTLFLDLWDKTCDETKFMLMYRAPHDVVDSLCRRLIKYKSPYLFIMPWLGCVAWCRYNERLLSFYEKNRDKSLLVNISGFIETSDTSAEEVKEWLGIENKAKFTEVYRPSEMGVDSNAGSISIYNWYQKIFYAIYSRRMRNIYERLESLSTITGKISQH